MTGPGFYDPVKEEFTEPAHTGISYSFSSDGFYEEAYYRSVANPTNPKCPKGIIQWQHGSFTKQANGSLVMAPIAVDGRQLYSDSCSYDNAIYTRYNTTEMFERYEVLTDPYHNVPRLNLYKFDGSPLMPLYLAYSPPQMLPTTTLNPLTTSTPGGAKATSKVRRSVSDLPLNHNVVMKRSPQQQRADRWWWFGVFCTASGGVLYYFF
ncbi:chaperone for protein-folding within the ER, fungal-domain-containing protein [Lophiotrema nucula]|uniref:Protein ROT1 n=1 Tax=Lophiotrema nucula TaxID=690887 RepID=A0A6A5Z1H8_9PLEO|nr:chaperone for protein-folding within the ER, fungal-domain-containing protein [Lophiotrema nucula]